VADLPDRYGRERPRDGRQDLLPSPVRGRHARGVLFTTGTCRPAPTDLCNPHEANEVVRCVDELVATQWARATAGGAGRCDTHWHVWPRRRAHRTALRRTEYSARRHGGAGRNGQRPPSRRGAHPARTPPSGPDRPGPGHRWSTRRRACSASSADGSCSPTARFGCQPGCCSTNRRPCSARSRDLAPRPALSQPRRLRGPANVRPPWMRSTIEPFPLGSRVNERHSRPPCRTKVPLARARRPWSDSRRFKVRRVSPLWPGSLLSATRRERHL
jgi:hypothetical protein